MELSSATQDTGVFAEHASPGQFVSVEIINRNRDRFKSSLLGLKAPHFLILELPSLMHYGSLRDQLTTGQGVIIRTICEKTSGACMGFHARVEGMVKSPYGVFFVNYPNQIETRELRNERRSSTSIAAQIFRHESDESIAGTIVDLSAGGCCLEIEVDESVMRIKARMLHVRFEDPAGGGTVTKLGRVCSQRREGRRMALGFAFEEEVLQKSA